MRYMLMSAMTLGLIGAAVLADVPTTQPTVSSTPPSTRPMHAKKPVPKDWVKFENRKAHFLYFVPKTWQSPRKSDDQTDFQFADPRRPQIAQMSVMAFTGCHQATIEEYAKVTKEEMPKQQPKDKWVSDETTDMGGKPAWMYVTETTTPLITIHNGVRSTSQMKVRTVVWTTIVGKDYYQIMLNSDGASYTRNLAFAQKVVDSIQWTDSTPTTQPGA